MSRSRKSPEKSTRVLITAEIVAEALARAARAKDSNEFYDYCDTQLRYLVLRQRGSRVGWFVRVNGQMKRIGNAKREPGDDSYLTVTKARDSAGARYYAMRSGRRPHTKGWSWADLDREFQASRQVKRKKGKRVRPPAPATLKDIAGCFDKPQFAAWRAKRLSNLTDVDLIELLDAVHRERGHGACCKTLAWVRATLTWARSERTIESGLVGVVPWWEEIRPPQPSAAEIEQMEQRDRDFNAAREAFKIDALGKLLVIHERYCAERSGNRKVSPAVRAGLWWLIFTLNRKFTCSQLKRDDLKYQDPLNPLSTAAQPWGTAEWPAEGVKNKRRFMLPIPPFLLHIVRCCQRDFEVIVTRKRGLRSISGWLFASSRRKSRRGHPDNSDPGLFPSSLNGHLRAMGGRKKTRKGERTKNYLEGLPRFWPHLVRTIATDFMKAQPDKVSGAAVSALLGHVLPRDRNEADDEMSAVTREFYLTSQEMPLKTQAMKLWSDAVLDAYVRAGGTLPMPHEVDENDKEKLNWPQPKLPRIPDARLRPSLGSQDRGTTAARSRRKPASPPAKRRQRQQGRDLLRKA
ncbi:MULTISPECIES: hypothetical protein [unclassified Bradyrhizobium]|uniref:hypothetical protein n=1 Tax=unclassified Bradyrhizobium TaxID=2631580 RepID=UPI00247A755E|nr:MULTISPECIES: hypothetical protein [unclassified Bradyrhizobium]WGR72690.1 hypothetical protein MTX24_07150 [Bradyrhizobium sp. ISRA426]WGR77523.1 hypothetical protein MTX21_32100 [Bradyrhizobium sp. ISRA430]WGR87929.1 hypothetical protein MTX25_07150 [Bradyrhizobium sp. ISRA432]